MSIIKMTDLNLKDKRVLIREDFNVPMQNGMIASEARISASLFTIEQAHKQGAKLMLMSHLGRPNAEYPEERFSLAPVAESLSKLLKHRVRLEKNWLDGVSLESGDIVLCENVRFYPGETKNDENLAKKMAALADIFVMDAFGVAHRAHASTYGVARFVPIACAGPLLVAELEALTKALENPVRPFISIVGGSKVSTKIEVLEAVLKLSDQLILGGGVANTFLAAQGYPIGQSLCEHEWVEKAKTLLTATQLDGKKIPLPVDVIVAKEFSADVPTHVRRVEEVREDEMIFDIGPETAAHYAQLLLQAKTIIWNGPVGVFEMEPFAAGTQIIAQSIAQSDAFSIAGGGDTLSAIEKFGVADDISYVSTGGGAFLEFLQKKKLPAVAILEQRALLKNDFLE